MIGHAASRVGVDQKLDLQNLLPGKQIPICGILEIWFFPSRGSTLMVVVSLYSIKPSQYTMARTGLKLICWMESRALGSKMSVDRFIRISGLKRPVRHSLYPSCEQYNLQEALQPVMR